MYAAKATQIASAALVSLTVVSVSLLAGGQQHGTPAEPHQMKTMGTSSMTKAERIANAMSAAPSSISGKAAIFDWPAKDGDQPMSLRAGTNGWSCFPDMPETKGNDPMCIDEPWMKWVEAYTAKKAPAVGRVGIGYMTASGGGWGSNTDPYAMSETSSNHWGFHPPHLMIVVPDVKSLAGISTDPGNGGPYVMYAGTPYAHIMAPTGAPSMAHK